MKFCASPCYFCKSIFKLYLNTYKVNQIYNFYKTIFVGCDGEPRSILDAHSVTCSLCSSRSSSRYRMLMVMMEYTLITLYNRSVHKV